MNLRRATYKPGKDVLAYVAVNKNADTVTTRVYGPGHHSKKKKVRPQELTKLEPGVFILEFDFEQIGNYIFVVEEDGELQTILNAKVYA